MTETLPPIRIALAADRQEDHDLVAALLAQYPRYVFELEVLPDLAALQAAARAGRHHAWLMAASLLPSPPDEAVNALVASGRPLILLLEEDDAELDERCFALGAWDCLVRVSLTPPVLARCIRRGVEHAALQAADRARSEIEKTDALRRMAGCVAHDFNNLLTAMLGYAEMLRESLPPDDPGRQDAIEIQRAGSRAANLTRQLLAYSGKNQIRPGASEIDEVFREGGRRLQAIVGDAVSLYVLHEAPLHPVRIDAARMEQVLTNLASNARDAMPSGGRLWIEADNVDVRPDEAARFPGILPGPHVVITAADTGAGMSAEVMAHLFEPFFTTKPKGQGTGLGLAVVYGLVRQARGHVAVESRPGEGTTVRIYLPKAE